MFRSATRDKSAPAGGGPWAERVLTLPDMTTALLTEGDLDRGQPPSLTRPHWRCGIVHAASGAVCTRRPHRDDEPHQGLGRCTRLAGREGCADALERATRTE
jgi:hypothetical protein